MRELLVQEFIMEIIITGIEGVLKAKEHFFVFGLICAGIEFLGACYDDYDWHTPNISEVRFRKALSLFPEEYHEFNKNKNKPSDFYSALRCGYLPVFLPDKNLEVTNEEEAEQKNWCHLKYSEIRQGEKRLVIISNTFFKDFENACDKVITNINKGILSLEKLKRPVLHV